MMATYRTRPADPEKLKAALARRGLTQVGVGKECGRSDTYVRNSVKRGCLAEDFCQLLELRYNIKPEEYAPDEKPEPIPEPVEAEAAFSPEELEDIVRRAVREEAEKMSERVAMMTRQEMVNLIRSTVGTALNEYHNNSIAIERLSRMGGEHGRR